MPVNYSVTYGAVRPRTFSKYGAACFASLRAPYPWISGSRRTIVRVDYSPRTFLRNEDMRKASIDICTWAKDVVPEITPYYEWLLKHKTNDDPSAAPDVSIDTTKRSGAYMIVAFSYARLGQGGIAYEYMNFRTKYKLSVPRALAFAANFYRNSTGKAYVFRSAPFDSFVEIYDRDMPKNLGKVQEREAALTSNGTTNTYSQVKKYKWRVGGQLISPDYMFTGAAAGADMLHLQRTRSETMRKVMEDVVGKDLFSMDYYCALKKKGMDVLVNSDKLFSFD